MCMLKSRRVQNAENAAKKLINEIRNFWEFSKTKNKQNKQSVQLKMQNKKYIYK